MDEQKLVITQQHEDRLLEQLSAFGSYCYDQGKEGKVLVLDVLEGCLIDILDELSTTYPVLAVGVSSKQPPTKEN